MRTKLALLLLLSSGCGVSVDVNDEFEPYFDSFMNLYSQDLEENLVIKFDANSPEGLCTDNGVDMIITVNPDAWAEMANDEDCKRRLIWHELTHCVLNVRHSKRAEYYMWPGYQLGRCEDEATITRQLKEYLSYGR